MKKSKFKPTTEESFGVGKIVGAKEAFDEVLELINDGANTSSVKVYVKSRIKSLVSSTVNNPLKQKIP